MQTCNPWGEVTLKTLFGIPLRENQEWSRDKKGRLLIGVNSHCLSRYDQFERSSRNRVTNSQRFKQTRNKTVELAAKNPLTLSTAIFLSKLQIGIGRTVPSVVPCVLSRRGDRESGTLHINATTKRHRAAITVSYCRTTSSSSKINS